MLALHALPGPMVSTLCQELDSLVRLVFLLAQGNRWYRYLLIGDAVSGRKWTRAGSLKRGQGNFNSLSDRSPDRNQFSR